MGLALAASLACGSLASSVLAQSPNPDLRAGRQLTPVGAAALEERLAEDPSDLVARVRLIGYYSPQKYSNEHARTRCSDHVLWLTKNKPEAKVLVVPACSLDRRLDREARTEAEDWWAQHLENMPDNLSVLRNAAEFFTFSNRKRAITLLEHAQRLDSSNPLWALELGGLHQLDATRAGTAPDDRAAARALAQFERAYGVVGDTEGHSLLVDLAKTALLAGRTEKARSYAESMLSIDAPDWNLGNRIHHGHLTLGRIALAEGDVEAAMDRLLKAGETPGSPNLDTFGPNMLLAKELLERGEDEVVLRYFEMCAEFWDMGQEELSEWTQIASEGAIPDFGANLVY